MEQEHHLAFGPFRLDVTQSRLWQGTRASPCAPMSFVQAMLSALLRAGRSLTAGLSCLSTADSILMSYQT
jgi:hypothetical protein